MREREREPAGGDLLAEAPPALRYGVGFVAAAAGAVLVLFGAFLASRLLEGVDPSASSAFAVFTGVSLLLGTFLLWTGYRMVVVRRPGAPLFGPWFLCFFGAFLLAMTVILSVSGGANLYVLGTGTTMSIACFALAGRRFAKPR